jgi:eukaryotic-like serine/threonine-protein kinase
VRHDGIRARFHRVGRARRLRNPARAAEALALEASLNAVGGVAAHKATRRMLDRAHQMAEGIATGELAALLAEVEGTVALLEGRWLEARRHAAEAERHLATVVRAHSSLRADNHVLGSVSLFWLGRSGEAAAHIAPLLREAEEHGSFYGWTWLKLLEGWSLMSAKRIKEAQAAVEAVRARLPKQAFDQLRVCISFIETMFHLFDGDGERALECIGRVSTRLGGFSMGQLLRAQQQWLHASAAIARACQQPAARPAMIRRATRLARRMEGERAPWISALARTVRACIASLSGDAEAVLRLLSEAEPLLEAHHFEGIVAAVRHTRGRLIGGDIGRALVERAESWMAAQQVAPECNRAVLPGLWNES